MPVIRQLPPSVINKIAAGEVIERPASVVKELLENSVDSGAKRIDVVLEQGGLELIRIADNGCGIEAAQLPLAVASHATSKIADADDLFRVRTLGFRGEALASIAEISHFCLRSRVSDTDAGAELRVHGGQLQEVVPCGCPVGTCVEVRNLFFNTPVRRKFMRSTQTELGHATEAFTRVALAVPEVHFTLRHGERLIHDLPPTDNWRQRITAFFGREVGESLIWIESAEEAAELCGYVANPSQSRTNNRMQFLFLNGRFIRDRSLQHALGEAYRGLLLTGRFPMAFLRLQLRPDAVDVNVHPTKLEVRFEDSGRIYSQLLATLRSRFLSTDLTAKVTLNAAPSPTNSPQELDAEALSDAGPNSALDQATAEAHRRDIVRWARGDQPEPAAPFALSSPGPEPRQSKFDFTPQPAWRPLPELRPLPEFQPFPSSSGSVIAPAGQPAESGDRAAAPRLAAPDSADMPSGPFETGAGRSPDDNPPRMDYAHSASAPRGMQIQNRYLVTETDEGMVVIDQHALHERILYEQIRARVLAGQLETQRLLVPEPVTLTPAESAAACDAQETLSQMGIEIQPFGGDTVLISAYPAMLARIGPQEILRQVVELLMSGGKLPSRRDILDELLHMISCKAAIKAGDRLSSEEVTALLEQRHLFQDTHHCPHGRPTALVFTREELDRRFQRT